MWKIILKAHIREDNAREVIEVPFGWIGDDKVICEKCGSRMYTMTQFYKAQCVLQHPINGTFFCLNCNELDEETKRIMKGVLSYPAGPSCGTECQRYGFYGCVMTSEKASYSDDGVYFSGEQARDQRLDCAMLGGAHPV